MESGIKEDERMRLMPAADIVESQFVPRLEAGRLFLADVTAPGANAHNW